MKIIKQVVMTVYEDGRVKMTERALADRDEATGRFLPKKRRKDDDTPFFPEFEPYMGVRK